MVLKDVNKELYRQKKARYTLIAFYLTTVYLALSIIIKFIFINGNLSNVGMDLLLILFMLVTYKKLVNGKTEQSVNLLIILGIVTTIHYMTEEAAYHFYVNLVLLLMMISIIYYKKYQLIGTVIISNILFLTQSFLFDNLRFGLSNNALFKTQLTVAVSGISFSVCALYLSNVVNEMIDNSVMLENIAIRDPLTGTFNRHYFYANMMELKSQEPVQLLMLDIDHFKKINDGYGHKAGDNVLKAISEILQEDGTNSMTFRWGGEEFLIAFYQMTKEMAINKSEMLRKRIEDFDFEKPLRVTVSMGLAEANFENEEALDRSISEADAYLYEAKKTGRNKLYY